MTAPARRYDLKDAARCARCDGPMVQLEDHRVHPCCEPEFQVLRGRAPGAARA